MAEDILPLETKSKPAKKATTAKKKSTAKNILEEETFVESKAALLIKATVTVPIILIWFILGFYMWIPLLVRKISLYIAAVITSALTREVEAVKNATINLEHAISFFMDGFRLIIYSLGFTGKGMPTQRVISREEAGIEFAFATFYWMAVLLILAGLFV